MSRFASMLVVECLTIVSTSDDISMLLSHHVGIHAMTLQYTNITCDFVFIACSVCSFLLHSVVGYALWLSINVFGSHSFWSTEDSLNENRTGI